MKLIEAYAKLIALKQDTLTTNDSAACLRLSIPHASQLLGRLAQAGLFVSLARGKWACSKEIDPLILPEALTAPAPSYVSFQTALYYHGMISQIPNTIYAASLARTRQYKTALGYISLHHIHPQFFFGFKMISKVKLATPEKALLDTLYLAPARSYLFSALPELEIPDTFNRKEAFKMIERLPLLRARTRVRDKLHQILRRTQNE